MAFTITRIQANGRELAEIGDPDVIYPLLPPLEDESFNCIRFIDHFGYTFFNRLQLERQFLPEWARLYEKASKPEQREILQRVERLAMEALRAPHRLLKFVGD